MYHEQPQLLEEMVATAAQQIDPEKARRLRGVLTQMSLRDEKVRLALAGTAPLAPTLDEPLEATRLH
jgi:hypothetical protein